MESPILFSIQTLDTLEKLIYYLSSLECGNIMKGSSKFDDKRKSLIG